MADQTDDFESTTDGTENTSDGAEDKKETSGAAEGTDESQGKSEEEEALRKMQSERDKEVARANKLQKQLDALNQQDSSAKDTGESEVPPQVQEWITAAKKNTQDALYKSNEKLEEYDVDPALIRGDTPAEMQASAKALGEFVDRMERDIRDSVLEEHGFTPAPKDAASIGHKSFKSMDKKEFDAIVDEALKG